MATANAALADDLPESRSKRFIEAILGILIIALAVVWTVGMPRRLGLALFTEQFMAVLLGLGLGLVFLMTDARGRRRRQWGLIDTPLAIIGLGAGLYLAWTYQSMSMQIVFLPTDGLFLAAILLVLVTEGVRRTTGIVLALVIVAFMALALMGHLLPEQIASRPVSLPRMVAYLGIDTNAIMGLPLKITVEVILVFLLLGQLLSISGGGQFFSDLAAAAMGRYRGGAGKIAVVGSTLFGSISGSAVANVVGTGIVTIPMMKRSGYPAPMAGGIEAVASTGGQLMPPIIGAAAFLVAEFTQNDYGTVMLAALIPILLYYVALFIHVDLMAARLGLAAIPRDQVPDAKATLRSGWHFPLPFVVFLVGLFSFNMPPQLAALYGFGVLVATSAIFGYRGERLTFAKLAAVFATAGRSSVELIMITAGAGIVIGVLALSGFAYSLSLILIAFAGESVLTLLAMAAIASVILGMGMPTVGVYVLLATLIAPALVQVGVPLLAAHLFVLYFGMLSMITPPVAIASFTAANLAGADAWRTSLWAVRLGWTAYIVPFLFVFSPALLLDDAPELIIWTSATAVIGIWFVTIGVVGWFGGRIGPAFRFFAVAAGLAVLIPSDAFEGALYLELGGVAAVMLLSAWFWLRRRQPRPAASFGPNPGGAP